MPTNILRSSSRPAGTRVSPRSRPVREVLITAGRVRIRAKLANSITADRIWAALPIYSTAETWGHSLHFETPIESGRERGAKTLGVIGEVYYWAEEDRILIVFGPTPISARGELRLPRPCNVLATTADDVTLLKRVTPGEKVSVVAVK